MYEVFVRSIAEAAKSNDDFRHVLATGNHAQVVIMSVPPGDEIGEEVHSDTDQVLLLVDGEGIVQLDGVEHAFKTGDLVLVKAGVRHNVVTVGAAAMKIITVYAPSHHPPGTVHRTKEEADKANY